MLQNLGYSYFVLEFVIFFLEMEFFLGKRESILQNHVLTRVKHLVIQSLDILKISQISTDFSNFVDPAFGVIRKVVQSQTSHLDRRAFAIDPVL